MDIRKFVLSVMRYMKYMFCLMMLFLWEGGFGQLAQTQQNFLSQLKMGGSLPSELLSERTAVIYQYGISQENLIKAQATFQKTGIDAIVYYDFDLALAGGDVSAQLISYLIGRVVKNLVFITKSNNGFKISITEFSKEGFLVKDGQPAWVIEKPDLSNVLREVYRTAANAMACENFLINEIPEKNLGINVIQGRRSEFFAIDLKVDQLAILKTGDEQTDLAFQQVMKSYPLKYKFYEKGTEEKEMRRDGSLFILSSLHSRGSILRDLLGYGKSASESALVSVTYPSGEPVLQNFPSEALLFKFYIRHIPSGTVYLGTEWDADGDWQHGLRNHIFSMIHEMKL